MNLIEIFEIFTIKEFAMILRCLLDRIPIIIGGKNSEFIDAILLKLTDSVPIRKEIIFGNDFVKLEELKRLYDNESIDFDNKKIIIRSPVRNENNILENIKKIKGWVIGVGLNGNIDTFYEIVSRLRKLSRNSLFIKLNEKNEVEFVKFYSLDKNNLKLNLEKEIIKNTFSETEYSLERMKRILDKKIQQKDSLNQSIIDSLIDLSQEEAIIKENIFKREIINFYQACRRGLALLSRLNFLNEFQEVKIGKKTFFDAISYKSIDSKRFLEFLECEWGENFQDLLDTSKLSLFGDHLDSLWG